MGDDYKNMPHAARDKGFNIFEINPWTPKAQAWNCAGIVEGIQLSKKNLRTVGALRVPDDNVRFGDVEYGHEDWPTICQILFNSIWYSNLERTSLKGLMARRQTSKQIKRVQGN